jgi:hypothetical protein
VVSQHRSLIGQEEVIASTPIVINLVQALNRADRERVVILGSG